MFRFALAGLATAEAVQPTGWDVSWSDCGAKHATVTDVLPNAIHLSDTLTVTGTTDEDVTSANFKATVTGEDHVISSCAGNATTDIVCDLPTVGGSVTMKAVSYPLKAGIVQIPIEMQINRYLYNLYVHIAATDQNGEDVICLNVNTFGRFPPQQKSWEENSSVLAVALASDDKWEAFKARFGKVYNGPDHEAEHKQVYEANMRWAAENSNEEVSFGENQFADLTQDQFRVAAGLGYKPNRFEGLPYLGVHVYNGEELADSVDWTTQGAVTSVKDQGQCGSCWAFSTTGGMEGAWQIASGSLTSMSEQQLVDCSTQNSGCKGGSMELAFNFAGTVNVATEASYPYKGVDGTCKSSYTTAIPSGGVTGYKSVDASTAALKSALNSNPVSVAVEASGVFQMYDGGILKNHGYVYCGTMLDHGVLAVGYGDGYFTVKNSWGASWGENGYIRISDEGNTCGILSDATYPLVSASISV